MQSPQTKLTEQEIAEALAKITIQLWRKNLTRMKIGQNSYGDLNRSFKYKVIAISSENEDQIKFAVKNSRKFHDNYGPSLSSRTIKVEWSFQLFLKLLYL